MTDRHRPDRKPDARETPPRLRSDLCCDEILRCACEGCCPDEAGLEEAIDRAERAARRDG